MPGVAASPIIPYRAHLRPTRPRVLKRPARACAAIRDPLIEPTVSDLWATVRDGPDVIYGPVIPRGPHGLRLFRLTHAPDGTLVSFQDRITLTVIDPANGIHRTGLAKWFGPYTPTTRVVIRATARSKGAIVHKPDFQPDMTHKDNQSDPIRGFERLNFAVRAIGRLLAIKHSDGESLAAYAERVVMAIIDKQVLDTAKFKPRSHVSHATGRSNHSTGNGHA